MAWIDRSTEANVPEMLADWKPLGRRWLELVGRVDGDHEPVGPPFPLRGEDPVRHSNAVVMPFSCDAWWRRRDRWRTLWARCLTRLRAGAALEL